MQIERIANEQKGKFIAKDGDTIAGVMTYTMAGELKLIIDHTEVEPGYEGKNIGKQLLFSLIEYVRSNGIKVLPLCPFARAMFKKMPEIRDVLV